MLRVRSVNINFLSRIMIVILEDKIQNGKYFRSLLGASAGPLLMEWLQVGVSQAHSADPGCLMEEPGTEPLPGTAWPRLNWPQELHVTTVMLSR